VNNLAPADDDGHRVVAEAVGDAFDWPVEHYDVGAFALL
jgi:hypothetical protein